MSSLFVGPHWFRWNATRHRPLESSRVPGIVATALALLTGCAPLMPETTTDVPTVAILSVQNGQLEDMRVYAVRGTARIRLGVVDALSTRSMRIRRHMLSSDGSLSLLAESSPRRTQVWGGPVLVDPGRRVEWWLAPSLVHSSLAVHD